MTHENPSIEDIAIVRDLVRRPEVKMLAMALAKIGSPSTAVVDKDNLPIIWVRMAHRLINHPENWLMLDRIREIL